ncbi:putative F420-0 ABC transporter substrate-binding protein [Agromyces sp. NPDC055661]
MPARRSHTTRRLDRRARVGAVAAVAVAALALTGCTYGPSNTYEAPDIDAYPMTLDNCGTVVTFDHEPERIVAIKSSTLELLLALGLQDRIVGTAFSDGPVPDEYAAAASGLEVLSDKVPSQEVTLAAEPDLVFAGWESNLSAEGAGDRATLDQLGVATYVAPSACKEAGYMPDPLTFDEVFADFEEAGSIFGVATAAADLIAQQRAALAAITPSDDGLRALWYSSGDDIPYVGAGIGAPQMIMDAAGLTNVAAEVHDSWTSMGWEAIVAANPDVIVLVDAPWNTAASKIAKLEANAATAALPAVQQRKYLVVDFPSTEAGVRNVGAVASLVEQLGELGY